MRPGRLTLVLLVLAGALLAAVPPIRHGFLNMIGQTRATSPSVPALEGIALAHPSDPQAWFGYAEADASTESVAESLSSWKVTEAAPKGFGVPPRLGKTSPAQAYQKALDLDPSSVAIRLRFALYHLARGGELDEERAPAPPIPDWTPHLVAAQELLQQCVPLAPENAAPGCLLASVLFAQGDDTAALATLREAVSKPHFDAYDREAAQAGMHLLGWARLTSWGRPVYVQSEFLSNRLVASTRLRSLARRVVRLGDEFGSRSRQADAAFCFGAVAQLGHLMRADAQTAIDGLAGIAVSRVAGNSFLTDEERQHLRQSGLAREERTRLEQAADRRFEQYLTDHGRAALAASHAEDVKVGEVWRADAKAAINESMRQLVGQFTGGAMLNTVSVWGLAVGLLALGALILVVSLIARYWREPSLPSAWRHSDWLLLLLLCLVPGQVVAVAEATRQDAAAAVMSMTIATAIGAVAWVVTLALLALRRRAGQPPLRARSPFQTVLWGLRTLLPPTLAATIVLSVIGFWPLQRNLDRFEREQQQILTVGEVRYWGIGTGHVGRHR